MQNKPLVTIIMNCFNGEKYLHDAIESVISQTYKNWELIFWDNLSVDNSSKIFNKFNDKRLKYFLSNEHTNLSEARAFAIDKSKGDIITFLDVDDYWNNSILEAQVALYKDDEVDFSCGNFYIVEGSEKDRLFKRGRIPSGYVLNNLLANYPVGLLTLAVRRSAYLSVGGFSSDYHIIGDFDLVIKLAANGKMGSFQGPLAYCRKDGNNESILKVDLYLQELKKWYKKNSVFYKSDNKKALDAFYISISYKEYLNYINNSSFSFSLFVSVIKKQPIKNIFKIIFKIFMKKLNGRRV